MRLFSTAIILLIISVFSSNPTFAATDLTDQPAKPVIKLEEFEAHYFANYRFGFINLSIDAIRKLIKKDDGSWLLTFDASTAGAGLAESSHFLLEDNQLIPQEYKYQTSGLLSKPEQHLQFNLNQQAVKDLINNKSFSYELGIQLQDSLSYMQQASLDLAAGKNVLDYSFFQEDRVRNYRYEVIDFETLNTRAGKISTVKLKRTDKKSRDIYAWFSLEHNFLLIRLAEYKKGKIAYEININKINP